MNEFLLWFEIGVKHILDLEGYDHMLFLIVLFSRFNINAWKKTLLLVTAFTLGHCITLLLNSYNVVGVNSAYIEVLIATTILISALINFFDRKNAKFTIYFLTFFFGLIHGLGFSNYLKILIGSSENIFVPLLSFNVGIELGQFLFISLFLVLNMAMQRLLKQLFFYWKNAISLVACLIAIYLIVARIQHL